MASVYCLNYLNKNAYEVRLTQYREVYENERIDKDVEDLLINEHLQEDRSVDPNVKNGCNGDDRITEFD